MGWTTIGEDVSQARIRGGQEFLGIRYMAGRGDRPYCPCDSYAAAVGNLHRSRRLLNELYHISQFTSCSGGADKNTCVYITTD